jgi:hypothetical protein
LDTTPKPSKRPRKRRIVLWTLLALFLAAIAWAAFSNNPFAGIIQEFAGRKHDQIVLQKSFSIAPRSFRYYTFSLTADSSKMSVIGQFSATPENGSAGSDGSNDSGIEFYVLNETAFDAWSHGQDASFIYDSRPVASGKVQVELPAGAGTYYLVFSNKSAPKTAKSIRATVLLHHKSWLPD